MRNKDQEASVPCDEESEYFTKRRHLKTHLSISMHCKEQEASVSEDDESASFVKTRDLDPCLSMQSRDQKKDESGERSSHE